MRFFIKSLWAVGVGVTTVAILISCEPKNQQTSETTTAPTDSITATDDRVPSSNQSELMRTIIGPPTGDFRGFNFGDPVSKLKSSETFEMFEDSTDHVGFTHETDNFESVDVIYYLDNNQAMNGVRIDVYLNNANAATQLWEQFDTYLSGKYTVEKRQGQTAFWRRTDGKKIKLENVSKDKDFGIRLIIGDKANTPTAAKINT
jgi:hypothetical protein